MSHKTSHTPALVSRQRGTTRDYLTATVSLNGIECHLVDTAGIGESPVSTIDLNAQALASERCEQAAIRALCIEATSDLDERRMRMLKNRFGANSCNVLVLTKADAIPNFALPFEALNGTPVVLTSSRSGQGLEKLSATFSRLLLNDQSAQRGGVLASTACRCRESVRLAEASLSRAAGLVRVDGGNELVAVELRAALEEIGRVVGAVYTNDLLDRIFGTFCIGK